MYFTNLALASPELVFQPALMASCTTLTATSQVLNSDGMPSCDSFCRVVSYAVLPCVVLIGTSCGSSSTASTNNNSYVNVTVYETSASGSALLAPQPSATFGTSSGNGSFDLKVTPSTVLQMWDGVGAAMTDSAATVIAALPSTQQQSILNSLFSQSSGIGLNMVRLPMGATDFTANGNYSYDDMASGSADPTLANFTIAHDQTNIIPLLQQAYTINQNLMLIGTPWSPPAWMKTNSSMNGVSGASTSVSQIYAADFPALANYFVKFIQAYEAQGLPVYAVSPQNEPLNSSSGYPSAILTASDEANFIGNYLGPALKSAGLTSVKILGLEDNWADTAYATTLLNSSSATEYLSGTSFHWYSGSVSAMATIHALNPNMGVWFTEATGTISCTSKTTCPTLSASTFSASGFATQMQLVLGVSQNYGRSVLGWNLALNQNEGPQNGGCYSCVGVITVDNSTSPASIYYNNMYYALGHIGKFVTPGAHVIETTTQGSTGVEDVGFLNPDGSIVVVAFNAGSTTTDVTVEWNSESFDYSIPAGAAVTFKWTPS